MIVALAGRRIDAADASPERFPAGRVDAVRARIVAAMREDSASILVSAAACGADLTALCAAEEVGIAYHIVLPFSPDRFREGSVVDRPGDWGSLYDRFILGARDAAALEILGLTECGDGVYEATNAAILDRALTLGSQTGEPVGAFVVWDGPIVGRTDYTKDFADAATMRGITVRAISALAVH